MNNIALWNIIKKKPLLNEVGDLLSGSPTCTCVRIDGYTRIYVLPDDHNVSISLIKPRFVLHNIVMEITVNAEGTLPE